MMPQSTESETGGSARQSGFSSTPRDSDEEPCQAPTASSPLVLHLQRSGQIRQVPALATTGWASLCPLPGRFAGPHFGFSSVAGTGPTGQVTAVSKPRPAGQEA